MPIYKYGCPECDIEFERIKSMRDHTASHQCPQCSRPAPQHITGGVGVTGFYQEEGWESDMPMDV